jgi:hypothetical protein
MLPLKLGSAFPEEAGLLATAGALATPTGLDDVLPAFLGGMRKITASVIATRPPFHTSATRRLAP